MVTQLTEYGDVVSAAPRLLHVFVPAGDVWNCAFATPLPASAEFAVTVNVPFTFADDTGAVTAPVGAVLSTRTFVIVADVNVLPATSVVITRRS